MRPIKIDFSGFTCFKEPQSIDFADLELFAIVGQTGAGKTSILDAITFALYGETPRLGSRGLEALVSQGSVSMYVTLEFEASGGTRYKVSRIYSLKATERQLRFDKFVNDAWVSATEGFRVTDVNKAIEAVVGLDYEGFTRAILLPQGEFDRFLRGEASERRDLLKSLINLDRFDEMRRRADEIARDVKAQASKRNELLDNEYAGATPEALEQLENRIGELTREMEHLKTRREQDRNDLDAARETARLWNELEASRARLSALEVRSPDVRAGAEKARMARRVAGLWPRVEAVTRAEEFETSSKKEFERQEKAVEAAKNNEGKARERFQKAREAARAIDELLENRGKLKEVRPRMERLRSLGGNIDTRHDEPTQFSEEAISELQRLDGRVSAWTGLMNQMHFNDEDRRKCREKLGEAANVIEQATKDQARCLEAGSSMRERVELLERDLDMVRRKEGAAALLVGLRPGDPCPVCDSPLRFVPEKLSSRLPSIEAALKQALTDRENLQGQYRVLGETIKNANREAQEAQENLEKFRARADELETERKNMQGSFEQVLGTFKDPSAGLREARDKLLAGLANEIRSVTGGKDPEKLLKDSEERQRQLEREEEEAQEALAETKESALVSRMAAETARRDLERAGLDVRARKHELDMALAEIGLADLPAARALTMPESEISKLEDRDREFRELLSAAQGQEISLKAALGGRRHVQEQLDELENRVTEIEDSLSKAGIEQGRSQVMRETLASQIETVKKLRKEKAELDKRYDVYASLAFDLRGDQFQEYLLTTVQNELLARASSIMREVTRERYTLTLQDKQYMVLDNWNGLEPRSVKTLSGGESFIASLSLALALSDYLAGHKALGALFLDEGFGTLDMEALESVASVLETIQTQGRMVGVITHVASLAERLPTRLMVEKGVSSSRAKWDAA